MLLCSLSETLPGKDAADLAPALGTCSELWGPHSVSDLDHQPPSPGSEALLEIVQKLHCLIGLRALGVGDRALGVGDLTKVVILALFTRLWGVGSSLPRVKEMDADKCISYKRETCVCFLQSE